MVKYYDAFVERNNLYIVMEFAEHGDIFRQITKKKEANKFMKESQVWLYFLQTAIGLKGLHDLNILHRVGLPSLSSPHYHPSSLTSTPSSCLALQDMKPKNIFLTGKHHIRIGDLGCSKLIKSSSGFARTQIGTPYYMSPEIWDKRPYDSKSGKAFSMMIIS